MALKGETSVPPVIKIDERYLDILRGHGVYVLLQSLDAGSGPHRMFFSLDVPESIFSESETRIAKDRKDFFHKCLLLRVQRVCLFLFPA